MDKLSRFMCLTLQICFQMLSKDCLTAVPENLCGSIQLIRITTKHANHGSTSEYFEVSSPHFTLYMQCFMQIMVEVSFFCWFIDFSSKFERRVMSVQDLIDLQCISPMQVFSSRDFWRLKCWCKSLGHVLLGLCNKMRVFK